MIWLKRKRPSSQNCQTATHNSPGRTRSLPQYAPAARTARPPLTTPLAAQDHCPRDHVHNHPICKVLKSLVSRQWTSGLQMSLNLQCNSCLMTTRGVRRSQQVLPLPNECQVIRHALVFWDGHLFESIGGLTIHFFLALTKPGGTYMREAPVATPEYRAKPNRLNN